MKYSILKVSEELSWVFFLDNGSPYCHLSKRALACKLLVERLEIAGGLLIKSILAPQGLPLHKHLAPWEGGEEEQEKMPTGTGCSHPWCPACQCPYHLIWPWHPSHWKSTICLRLPLQFGGESHFKSSKPETVSNCSPGLRHSVCPPSTLAPKSSTTHSGPL